MEFELEYSREQEAFRNEVREWLSANIPAGISISPRVEEHPREEWEARRELGRRLGAKGWLWPLAPKQYGGGGLTTEHAIILHEEMDRYHLSMVPYSDSASLVAPAVMVWGSEEQKSYFLPQSFKGEVVYFQCLTEPEVGSDLASVKTLAVRDGDEYVINGHKTFIGAEHGVDYLWTIAVTDPKAPRHENVSWFIVPADAPGITMMPLDLMGSRGTSGSPDGYKNSIFFDNVRVPVFNLIGGANNGWKVASTHLELEHGGGGNVGRNLFVEMLWDHVRTAKLDGGRLWDDQDERDILMDAHFNSEITRLFGLRNFYLAHSKKERSYGGSQLSLHRKQSGLDMTHHMARAFGYTALLADPAYRPMDGNLEVQQREGVINTHPGGTMDVQKLIISRRIGIGRTSREEAGQLA